MRIEVGKELEAVGHRLSDVVYLAEKTAPVRPWWPWSWRDYSKDVLRLIAIQAKEAQTALAVQREENSK